jgi:uncharacterized Tic20 family protein
VDSQPLKLTSEERWLAALAHGSVLLSFFGPLVPGMVWLGQRKKSRYAAFQSLQAMGYQALLLWAGLTVLLTGLLVFIFSAGLPSVEPGMNLDEIVHSPLAEQSVLFQNIFSGVWAVMCLPGIIGAVFALAGREFHYPFWGKRLEARLTADADGHWFNEAREADWVAGICHASAATLFWGMILPWLVWTAQKEKTSRLRFQSLQAFLFQLFMLVSYGAAFILLFTLMWFVLALAGYMNFSAGISSDAGLYLIIAVLVMLLFMAVMLLALPTFHLFALVAWARTWKGQDYRYPLLGKFLARRMQPKTQQG